MPKYQRDKGHRWEREVAAMFRDALPGCEAKRGMQTRGGAAEAPDVDVPGVFYIECKVGKKPPVRRALCTAVENCPKGRHPIAIIKEDRRTPYAVIPLCDLLDILGEWWQLKTR